jgi:4-amino-4-deoxy-L-arabinose transferase-like glycosyltransferase
MQGGEDQEEKIILHLEAPEGMRLRVTVERLPDAEEEQSAGAAETLQTGDISVEVAGLPVKRIQLRSVVVTRQPQVAPGAADAGSGGRKLWRQVLYGDWTSGKAAVWLFGLALVIYLTVRWIGVDRYPIYFFSDEAVQTMLASDLLRDGLRGADQVFLPTYFKNGSYYNLGISVYLQVLPYLLFSKSVIVTRATSVLVTLLAAVSIGLMLRDLYRARYWWLGPLLLSITPAWFLHSRTAFETVLFVSFYAAFLYAYGLYRLRNPGMIYAACVLAALAFYSYSPGQLVVAVTAFLLLLSDARYHWQQRGVLLRAALIAVVLALPYFRFQMSHPGTALEHLRLLDAYIVQPLPPPEKLARLGELYLFGLSPRYWFAAHDHDLPRHVMDSYGHISWAALPFIFLGLIHVLRRVRSSPHRMILIALLAAPAGGVLVGIGITRVLSMVIPAAVLASLGIEQALLWMERPGELFNALSIQQWRPLSLRLPPGLLGGGIFLVLGLLNFNLLREAITNGPLWHQDYSLGGMQYGASQVYGEVLRILKAEPDTYIILSPVWTNGADIVARFFLGDPLPIELGSVRGHIERIRPLDERMLFIVTPEEYQLVKDSGKFKQIQVEQIMPYPNGKPGFYFLRLSYADNIQAIFDAEQEQRRQLQEGEVELDGEKVGVRYSLLDIGSPAEAYDGDPYSLTRTLEANPAVFELTFSKTRTLQGISVIIGSIEAQITALLFETPQSEPRRFVIQARGTVSDPEIHLEFGAKYPASVVRVEVLDLHQDEPAHVHVWEIRLK